MDFNWYFWGGAAVVLLLITIAARRMVGFSETRTYQGYREALERKPPLDPGVIVKLTRLYLYPFWRMGQWLLGNPKDTRPVIVPKVVGPMTYSAIASMVRSDLAMTIPGITQHFLDAVTDTIRKIVARDYRDGMEPAGYTAADAQPLVKLLSSAFADFLSSLPAIGPSPFRATIPDLTTAMEIRNLFYHFRELFPEAYRAYSQAAEIADFLTKDRDKLRMRSIGGWNSTGHIRQILRDYPEFREAGVPITVPPQSRFEGMWIVAPPGRGKTTFLSALLAEDLKLVSGGTSIILMDSKGDLIEHVRQLKQFGPGGDLAGKLILIEPSANLAINPLDLGTSTAHTISLMEYVFSALLDSKTTSLQSTLFRSVLLAMKAIPNATFATFREFLQHGWEPYEKYIRTLDPEDRDFFIRPLADGKSEYDSQTYRGTKQELLWRIRDLTTKVPLLRQMFRAPKTKIDLGTVMDGGNVIVIDNSVAQLTAEGSQFFGRFFVALILSAAQQRAGRKVADKNPVIVYMDEAQTVIADDPTVATIIQTCRSQRIAMIFAHQELQQIKSPDVRSALANCAIRVANPDADAKALADDFRTDAEFLTNIPKGSFASFVRDHTIRPIILGAPNDPVWDWPKMSDDELAKIREDMRQRFSFTPPPVREVEETVPEEPDTAPKPWRG